jgi:hypothetical protein
LGAKSVHFAEFIIFNHLTAFSLRAAADADENRERRPAAQF